MESVKRLRFHLKVTNFDKISGVQFTLEWDASVSELGDRSQPGVKVATTVVKVRAPADGSITIPIVGIR